MRRSCAPGGVSYRGATALTGSIATDHLMTYEDRLKCKRASDLGFGTRQHDVWHQEVAACGDGHLALGRVDQRMSVTAKPSMSSNDWFSPAMAHTNV